MPRCTRSSRPSNLSYMPSYMSPPADFETRPEALSDLEPCLALLAKATGKDKGDLVIYDPVSEGVTQMFDLRSSG
jgi:hypothetical protein